MAIRIYPIGQLIALKDRSIYQIVETAAEHKKSNNTSLTHLYVGAEIIFRGLMAKPVHDPLKEGDRPGISASEIPKMIPIQTGLRKIIKYCQIDHLGTTKLKNPEFLASCFKVNKIH